MKSSHKKILAIIVNLSILAAIAVAAVEVGKAGDVDLGILIQPNTVVLMAPTVLLIMASVFIRGVRWGVLLGPQAGLTRRQIVAGFAWCFLILQALPFRMGEAARLVWLKTRGGSATDSLSSVVIERLIDLIVLSFLLLSAIAASPMLAGAAQEGSTRAAIILFTGCIVLALAPFVLRPIDAFASRYARGRLREILIRLLTHLGAATSKQRLIPALLLTLLAWGCVGAGFTFLLSSTFPEINFIAAITVLAATNLSAAITMVPGNLGVFEAVTVVVLAWYGVPASEAIPAAILLHLCVFAGQLFAGIAGRLSGA